MRKVPLLLGVFLILCSSFSFGQLREHVALVEPVFHQDIREGFSEWADYFEDLGRERWERFFRWYAGEFGVRGYGSGWVYVGDNDVPYVVTNRHVVRQASAAKVVFEDLEGERRVFHPVSIVYVDEEMDLAVLQLPARSFDTGFPLGERRVTDGTTVFAVGYPGFRDMPLWQFSMGIVSNAAARIDPAYTYLLQHTAPIDPGNSGGPLLVAAAESPLGYKVIGVNVSKANERQNTSFAIPAFHVSEVLARAELALDLEDDPDGLAEALEDEAQALAGVLASPETTRREIGRFVSYAFVGDRGFQSYLDVLALVTNDSDWVYSFVSSPIETMRASINTRFLYDLQQVADRSTIHFRAINDEDRRNISKLTDIRTTYAVGDKSTEVIWIREYGHWRVKHASARKLVDVERLKERYRRR